MNIKRMDCLLVLFACCCLLSLAVGNSIDPSLCHQCSTKEPVENRPYEKHVDCQKNQYYSMTLKACLPCAEVNNTDEMEIIKNCTEVNDIQAQCKNSDKYVSKEPADNCGCMIVCKLCSTCGTGENEYLNTVGKHCFMDEDTVCCPAGYKYINGSCVNKSPINHNEPEMNFSKASPCMRSFAWLYVIFAHFICR